MARLQVWYQTATAKNIDHWRDFLVEKSEAHLLLAAMYGLIALTEQSLKSPDLGFNPIFCSAAGLPERTEVVGD